MGTNQRFHNPDNYYLEHIKKLLDDNIKSGRINTTDRRLIEEFISEIVAISQISPTRRYKLVGIIIRNREYLPPYADCSISDVYTAIDRIKTGTKADGTPRYTKNSVTDLIQIMKRFFIWMCENGYSDMNLQKLTKIKVPLFDKNTVTAEMILTEDEVKRIIEAATTTRDRALLSVLYEGGFRIGEIGHMKWSDVKFTNWNVTVNTSEKTGKPRYVPLVAARAYLAQWKNDYPLPITDDSFVFLTTTTKKPLQYAGLTKQIRVMAERAGIKKYIKPHLFRHSRITHLLQQGMQESKIKLLMWGDVNTDMLKVYQHLTNEDIDSEVARLNGIELEEKDSLGRRKKGMQPLQCQRCATINSPAMKYCGNCGAPLAESEVLTTEVMENEIVKYMTENPAFMGELALIMQDLAKRHRVEPIGK